MLLPAAAENQLPPLLLDLRDTVDRDETLEAVQLLEGAEYRYRIGMESDGGQVVTDRPEIFQPDDATGRTGRLRPQMHVGTLPLHIRTADGKSAEVAFEVRSKRLDYLTQYRWMLRDIAEAFSEAIMERFGTTEQQFGIDETGNARTLYQRFAFLKALLKDEVFDSAIRLVLNRPYVAWREIEEGRQVSQGLRIGPAITRQISRPGPRVPGALVVPHLGVEWPQRLNVHRSEESVDNPPNRFVKFALARWRMDVFAIRKILENEPKSAPVSRGIAEATQLVAELDEFLSSPLFADVESVQQLPTSNPVLLRKEGYREILRAYVQLEMAAKLGWDGGEEVYGAGMRNVATLYEFWTFLQLAQILAKLCDKPLDLGQLLQPREDGLNLLLMRGQQQLLEGSLIRLGRKLDVQLWFNRSFPRSTRWGGSWSRGMRPDCSVLIRAADTPLDNFRTVWIHFDAKYRAKDLVELLGQDEQPHEPLGFGDAATQRDDLLKMHAYRDSIRKSAGAYVLYPGSEEEQCREYHELLPGLGAFALRPSENGVAAGQDTLARFLSDVFDHTASQFTQHERGRYWEDQAYAGPTSSHTKGSGIPFLEKPPADSTVLIGYVKSRQHLEWILRNRLYNLRADDRLGHVDLTGPELAAEFILLYGTWTHEAILKQVVGAPRILQRSHLLNLGYPAPRSTAYLCLPLVDPAVVWRPTIDRESIHRLRNGMRPITPFGAPFVVSWQSLMSPAVT